MSKKSMCATVRVPSMSRHTPSYSSLGPEPAAAAPGAASSDVGARQWQRRWVGSAARWQRLSTGKRAARPALPCRARCACNEPCMASNLSLGAWVAQVLGQGAVNCRVTLDAIRVFGALVIHCGFGARFIAQSAAGGPAGQLPATCLALTRRALISTSPTRLSHKCPVWSSKGCSPSEGSQL